MSYVLVSDLHNHNWSAFATITPDGMSSRLQILLDELWRIARHAADEGISTMIVAGDVFHVRGSVAPSVLNPVKAMFTRIAEELGLGVYILSGNHDLEGKNSTWIGSAVSSLQDTKGVTAINNTEEIYTGSGVNVVLIPWHDNLKELEAEILRNQASDKDLIIHAPINSVIKGIPDTGLDPNWLNDMEYRRIFAGHYHHHKQFGKVYSIGAIAHHTWSDVGSKAGYMIVKRDSAEFFASHCPSFIDLDASMSVEDMALEADGNYVRARIASSDLAELEAMRQTLLDAGARGVMLISEPVSKTVSREATSIKKGMTLRESVASFIDPDGKGEQADLLALCDSILTEAEAVK